MGENHQHLAFKNCLNWKHTNSYMYFFSVVLIGLWNICSSLCNMNKAMTICCFDSFLGFLSEFIYFYLNERIRISTFTTVLYPAWLIIWLAFQGFKCNPDVWRSHWMRSDIIIRGWVQEGSADNTHTVQNCQIIKDTKRSTTQLLIH